MNRTMQAAALDQRLFEQWRKCQNDNRAHTLDNRRKRLSMYCKRIVSRMAF